MWTKMISIGAAMAVVMSFAVFGTAHADMTEEQLLVDHAHLTLMNFQDSKDMGWYRELLPKAEGVLIVPELFKAGFLLGGSGGEGVLFVRDPETGGWTGPAFYNLGSITGGLQIGAQVAETVILVMNRQGVEVLYSPSVKLGTDVSVAVGPVGAGAEGATAHNPTATFVSFMLAKGAFIGLTLEGAVVDVDDGANAVYYGKPVMPSDIIVKRAVSSEGASKLKADLAGYAARKK